MIRHEKLTPPIVMQRFGTNIRHQYSSPESSWLSR